MTDPPRSRFFISIVGTVGAVVLGIVGLGALANLRPEPVQSPPPEKRFNVDVFVAQQVCLRETISGFGTVRPDQEVTISAQVSGAVLSHDLEVGNRVAKNSAVISIDSRTYQQRVNQVENQLAEGASELKRLNREQQNSQRMLAKVKSDYETASGQYERRKSLQSREIVTADELSRALLELKKYEEAVIRQEQDLELYPLKIDQVQKRQNTTQAALELAKLDLEHAEVKVPFDGIISEVFVETGQYVRVGDPLLRITSTAAVDIPIPITLSDYEKLRPFLESGQTINVELTAETATASPWRGTLTRAAPEADQENRTIQVYVDVDNTTQPIPLLPGTFVSARIEGPILENVVAIPRETVINQSVLIAQPDAETAVLQKTVTPFAILENIAVLKTGVEPGQKLILTNLDVLYRSPTELQQSAQPTKRKLTINQTHSLKEWLDEQPEQLLEITECPNPKPQASRSGG